MFDVVLEALTDQEWHTLPDLKQKTNMPELKLEHVLLFLADWRLISENSLNGETVWKIKPHTKEFLERVKQVEG